MSSNHGAVRLAFLISTLVVASSALGYDFILDPSGAVTTWRPGTIPMQVKLPMLPNYQDGTNPSSSVVAAMATWNEFLGTAQFSPQIVAPSSYGLANGVSEIVMDSAIGTGADRHAFGQFTLAVTVSFPDGNFGEEADIIFNTNHTWSSFRGGQPSEDEDIRRVAIHELGHVLGLDHPDEAVPPQFVAAIMNSTVSYSPPIDTLQEDDIAGAQVLYGYPGFVSPNDHFSDAIELFISGTAAQVGGTNVAASKESGEPDHALDEPGGRSVWWKWTASQFGIVNLTTLGSNFDTLLGAYTGNSVDALTQLAGNDDVEQGVIRTSTITFAVSPGTAYYIAVDGWDGNVGTIKLNLSFTPDASRPLPIFTSRPLTRNAIVGQAVEFSASVESVLPVQFSWKRNGQVLPGQIAATLSLPPVTIADSGIYEVTATSANGSDRSFFHFNVFHPDLTAIAWGSNSHGLTSIPPNLGNLLAVSSGGEHVLALKADGTVAAWGDNYYQQSSLPAGLSNVVAISAGNSHSLALLADGTVKAWGDNPYGTGSPENRVVPPADLDEVIAISAGFAWSMALRADGTVVTWGDPVDGRPQQMGKAVAIASGPLHALVLQTNGKVVGWGSYSVHEYPVPGGLNDVTAISAGGTGAGGHSLALRADGTVVAWGYNSGGQSIVPAGLSNVFGISAGGEFSLAVKDDGILTGWGAEHYGVLYIPQITEPVVEVSAGRSFAVALIRAEPPTITKNPESSTVQVGDLVVFDVGATGTPHLAHQWRRNGVAISDGNGISGSTSSMLIIESVRSEDAGAYTVEIGNVSGTIVSSAATLTVIVPPSIDSRPTSRLVQEGGPVSFSVATSGAGEVTYLWSHNRRLIEGATGTSIEIGSATLADAGYYELTARNPEGGVSTAVFYLSVAVPAVTLTTWGANPPVAPQISGAISAISNKDAVLALKGDGTVVAWGRNDFGQAGPPVGLKDVVAIDTGDRFSMALKSDGEVVAWGENGFGITSPPFGLADVVAISAGAYHALALRSDGTVVAWGDSFSGATTVPPGLRGVVAIEAGYNISYAVKSDGTIVTWGFGAFSDPFPPPGIADVVRISSGSSHQIAFRPDGTVVAWGSDSNGATIVPQNLAGVVAASAGEQFSLVLKQDGLLAAWGLNYAGQTTIPEGLGNVVAIAADNNWSMAVARATPPVIVTQPTATGVVSGDSVNFSVAAIGSVPLAFQWRRDGVNLTNGSGVTGATSSSLWIHQVNVSDAGAYDVLVSNAAGSVVSEGASLAVARLSRGPWAEGSCHSVGYQSWRTLAPSTSTSTSAVWCARATAACRGRRRSTSRPTSTRCWLIPRIPGPC